jgi:hypothetical protein
MTAPNLQIKNKDGTIVQIARASETALNVITQGVISLVDNARKGTVEAITYTIKDTCVVIEATTKECLVRARLSKAERIGKVYSEYFDKLTDCGYQPHVVAALDAAYASIFKQELNKVVGQEQICFEDIEFVNKT